MRLFSIKFMLVILGSFSQFVTASDLILLQLSKHTTQPSITSYEVISNHAGYNNQPYFSKDGRALLYTSAIQAQGDSNEQTDILSFDLVSKVTKNITQSPSTSEFSPTPDVNVSSKLVVVKVEEDATQRLWQIDVESGSQTLYQADWAPIGYFAENTLGQIAAFVLGDVMTLQLKSSATASPIIMAEHIGRTIRVLPQDQSFVFSFGKEQQVIHKLEPTSQTLKPIIALPKDQQDFTLVGEFVIVTAQGNQLLYTDIRDAKPNWQPWLDVSKVCAGTVSRLAYQGEQHLFALVCEPTQK